jgi:succinylglutamate desuccinylase
MSVLERIIGRYGGHSEGPLVIAFGALHGNEPAGVQALQELFRMLDQEPTTNPGFLFKGKIVGMIGHLQAYSQQLRYLQADLNRAWEPSSVREILESPATALRDEAREVAELFVQVQAEISAFPSTKIVFLDLHTTSAEGGIFSIPTDETHSLELARDLYAPVILGLQEGIRGTLLKFAAGGHFLPPGHQAKISAVAFESGQHQNPQSVERAISAAVSCLRSVGCVRPHDVESRHDQLLRWSAKDLPPVVQLRYVHHIKPEDQFKMRPGYSNFQAIHLGEHLADDVRGPVHSPLNGLILMPLYQPKGADGFFIVN